MGFKKRQDRQPKPYWNIKVKSNECKYWKSYQCECQHPKRNYNFGDFYCNKNKCPIRISKLKR